MEGFNKSSWWWDFLLYFLDNKIIDIKVIDNKVVDYKIVNNKVLDRMAVDIKVVDKKDWFQNTFVQVD